MSLSPSTLVLRGMGSPAYRLDSDPRMIVIDEDINVKAQRLLREAKVAATRQITALSAQEADHHADNIILQTVAQIAFVAIVPAYINWMIWVGVMATGVVRMGRVYGRELTWKKARDLSLQVLWTAGATFLSVMIGGKILTALVQTTVLAYPVAVAIDAATSSALAYALMVATKAHFNGASRAETGAIVRREFDSYKAKLKKHKSLPTDAAAVVPFDYAQLELIAASPAAREVLDGILQQNPDEMKELVAYLRDHRLARLSELSIEHWKALDKENGLAQRIWSVLCLEIDMATLLEVANNPEVDVEIVKSLDRLCDGAKDVMPVAQNEAARFSFPPQHPRPRVLYVRHPYMSATYYPAAGFHRLVFEHKLLEATRLLEALGATYLEVEQVSGRSQEIAAAAGGGSLIQGVEAIAEAGTWSRSGAHIVRTGTYKDTGHCGVPDDLIWYQHEPLWQQIAQARLDGRLQKFRLEVHYDEDFGVNADLQANVLGFGCFELGGKFESREAFGSRIVGVFGEPG